MTDTHLNAPATVASLYCFTPVTNPATLQAALRSACAAQGLLGTILISAEGINVTLAGTAAAVDVILEVIRDALPAAKFGAHLSTAPTPPFRRLKVRVHEILTDPGEATTADGGDQEHLNVDAWQAALNDDTVQVLDVRNDYEYRVGHFDGAINPAISRFAEFADFVDHAGALDPARPVAMYCTGGIRCEKASAVLRSRGFATVFQLHGGILRYLSEVAESRSRSRWRGDCFVFDDRVAVGPDLLPADITLCHGCRGPLTAADRKSPLYEPGICCAYCHEQISATQRAAFAERRRQVALADDAGREHLGVSNKPTRSV